mgnify:CR=1 FL=1
MRRRIRDEEHTGELNIVPYLDVVVNLVMFMLLSMTGLIALGVAVMLWWPRSPFAVSRRLAVWLICFSRSVSCRSSFRVT